MPRPKFTVTREMRDKVQYLARLGIPHDDISKIIDCSPKTLRKHFRKELDRGAAEANAAVSGYLFAAIKAGNIPATIFWLKTRGGWVVPKGGGDSGTGSGSSSPPGQPPVMVYLPDNGRSTDLTLELLEKEEQRARKDEATLKRIASLKKARIARAAKRKKDD
jgi:hypothetical protein